MVMEQDVVLRYTGTGFVPDVPARDLTAGDLAALKEVDDAALAAHGEMVKALPKGAPEPEAPVRRDRRWLQKSGLYVPVSVAATGDRSADAQPSSGTKRTEK